MNNDINQLVERLRLSALMLLITVVLVTIDYEMWNAYKKTDCVKPN